MKFQNLLSRWRFEVVALAIALGCCVVHLQADTTGLGEVEGQASLGEAFFRGIQVVEGRATDIQFRLRGPKAPHPDVLVVAVDEKSAQRQGRWPWPRAKVAKALATLNELGANAVGLDIVFADEVEDTASSAYRTTLTELAKLRLTKDPEGATQLAELTKTLEAKSKGLDDIALEMTFRAAPRIVQGAIAYGAGEASQFSDRAAQHEAMIAPHVIRNVFGRTPGAVLEGVPVEAVKGWRQRSIQTPLPRFAQASAHLAYFNVVADPDGTLRRLPLFARLDRPSGFVPGLPLTTAAVYYGAKIEPVYSTELERLVSARLRRDDGPPIVVPLQTDEPYTLINHVGPASVFKTVSFSDLVDGTVAPEEVRGKAVLVGVTMLAGFDQRVTPFSTFEPGVFTQASFLSNILSGDFLIRSVAARLSELAFMLLSALSLAWLLPRARFSLKVFLIFAIVGLWLGVDQALFARGVQLATVMPVSSALLGAFAVIFVGYLSVDREKGRLRVTFKHYLNESVMEQMLQDPDRLKLGGEKREMTVLFSDIRGFTTLSERMTPEALVKFVNAYLTPMTRIVFEEGGTLDKYIGDALMAFWGAPVDQPNHALRACRAAVRMLQKLEELRREWKEQNLPDIDIGVGINSGPMIVGNMGSDVRFDYTVMGDAVNLASRLEGTNKEYETRLLISESTYQECNGQVIARRLGAVRVKGKRKPVRIYELRGLGEPSGTEVEGIRRFEAAIDAYTEQRFVDAERLFESVLAVWPDDPPTKRYLEEVAQFRMVPPEPGWDGVYTATTK